MEEKMSKGKTKKRFTNEFKLNIVLEGYASGNFSSTAARHGVHISQINRWKQQLLEKGSLTYASGNAAKSDWEIKIEQMEKTIGRLALENDILKKTRELLS